MFPDARIGPALATMLQRIDPPPVPVYEIRQKVSRSTPDRDRTPRYPRAALAAAAAIALFMLVFPATSRAVVQTIEARYRAALQAMGGAAPPAAPRRLVSSLTSQGATLASARARVPFTLVAPAGLPGDVISSSITTAPTAAYSKTTGSWRVGPRAVTFSYKRADGRSFRAFADRFDPASAPPGRYLFEKMDPASDGRPVLVKHEQFAWRNGDQMMTIVESAGISASEINAIQGAMHGTVLPPRELHAPDSGGSVRLHQITVP